MMKLSVIVLAAGQGTRMRSPLPKVLHPIGGRPLLGHVLQAIATLPVSDICVVVPPHEDRIQNACVDLASQMDLSVYTVPQSQPLGTGHGVREALSLWEPSGDYVLITCGDTPLLTGEILQHFWERVSHESGKSEGHGMGVIGMRPQVPGAYGRLICDVGGDVVSIVEAANASEAEKAITLCNSGVFLVPTAWLKDLVGRIQPSAPKGEFYLTDIVHLAKSQSGIQGRCVVTEGPEEVFLGVNTQQELAQAEALLQQRWRAQLLAQGVTMMAPETIFLSYDTRIGSGTLLFPHVFFGPGVMVGESCTIRPYCMLTACRLESHVRVGPFAHVRPGSVLEKTSRIGNFVEIKNTVLASGSHVDHLSYIGDSDVGENASIGAGTITCNYNGFEKFRTTIGAGAFVGSNTTLISPVVVGKNALIAAGSVITKDVPEEAMAFGRARQAQHLEAAKKFREKALAAKINRSK